MWEGLMEGVQLCLRLDTFFMMSLGILLGMFVGALPGFNTTLAMSILLPISFFLNPLVGIPFLLGVYKGGIYGGSVSAILIGIPGTAASVATTFDGPALTKKGQGRKALEMAHHCSVFGDSASDIVTIFCIGPIAAIALKIRPPELTAIITMALLLIAVIARGSMIKGLVMCFLGLMLGMVGQDPSEYMPRFNFGIFELKTGIPFIPMIIGIFAIPEILQALEQKAASFVTDKVEKARKGERLTFKEFRRCFRTILRSTGIGCVFGAVPGIGQVVAAFVGYATAKRASKHPETFGQGELEGVAAAETANNAVNGPTLVPLLTLGIPGDNITAVLLGAFVAQGLRPGPTLFAEQGPLVYGILTAMLLANFLFFLLGYVTVPLLARVVRIQKASMLPIIMGLAFAGVYVFRGNPFDFGILIFFGIFGYIARKFHFDFSPMVMAFILGPLLEYSFGQTLNLSRGDFLHYIYTQRPIAGALFAITPILVCVLAIRSIRKWRRAQELKTERR
jgi:putative tricarboxylic transport membrane protein